MRLTRIKLGGFKSFVDPTTIELKNDLVCIVGPNGCGKSNTIDAVRWVMGESSAKHLRGDSMTDVIFNGSSGRKPVGQAFVELVFDNADGTLGGEYASYSEIAVKRVVTRDAQSTYYLNGVRCRRRDITQIFLGTGLGPRSYSIIEQGMISKLIEARPEDLRQFIEETAGISKYKDRRRETETRMRHTRENLERVSDIRDELIKQQEKLQRQAKSAEQYKIYKEEERTLEAQVHALNWRDLNNKANQEQATIAQSATQVEEIQTHITSLDNKIEQERQSHHDLNETLQQAQNHFYAVGSEVARIEQTLTHEREKKQQWIDEHTRVIQERAELKTEYESDIEHAASLKSTIEALTPEVDTLKSQLEQALEALSRDEAQLEAWQKTWDAFNQESHQIAQKAHGEQTTLTHLENSTVKASERLSKVKEQLAQLQTDALQAESDAKQGRVQEAEAKLAQAREALEGIQQNLDTLKTERKAREQALSDAKTHEQTVKAQLISQEALQQAALAFEGESLNDWLNQHQLNQYPKLANCIQVEPGYEQAVEAVLSDALQSICMPNLDELEQSLNDCDASCLFIESGRGEQAAPSSSLAQFVRSDSVDLIPWLGHVFVAEDFKDAIRRRQSLQPHQMFITRDGICVTRQAVRVTHKALAEDSIIAREGRIKSLQSDLQTAEARTKQAEQSLEALQQQFDDAEYQKDMAQRRVNEQHRLLSEARAEFNAHEKALTQATQQRQTLEREQSDLTQQLQQDNETIRTTRESLAKHLDIMAGHEVTKQAYQAQKAEIQTSLTQSRDHSKTLSQQYNSQQIALNQAQSAMQASEKNQARMQSQLETLAAREADLSTKLNDDESPISQLETDLESQLKLRANADEALNKARSQLDEKAHGLRETERERHRLDTEIQSARERLNELKLKLQEVIVRKSTIEETLAELQVNLEQTLETLSDEAKAREYEQNLNQVRDRIKRLGAINLAAIEEYDATHERAEYLNKQHEDLTQALAALDDAIAKIDKETKDRFKETFDTVNNHLKQLFPSIFGGGEAYLELTGEDLLDTGITIMARPPGKKNSTIHLLSGGEKALTALALVFSLFRLNPSPFCMLDEVDAPLDDTNVGRYCNLVKEMSKSVQFIYITHNKLSMEMADVMMGVTMREPGVSRIVSVDIDEAMKMAEA